MQGFLLKQADEGADAVAMDGNGTDPVIGDGSPLGEASHVWRARVPDLKGRAVEAALASTTVDRAWALVRLAADLRALKRPREALNALDLAWHLLHPWLYDDEDNADAREAAHRVAAAMFTCAIASHCDEGDFATAHLIADEQHDPFEDVLFARAACRVYATLLADTGEHRWWSELEHYVALANGDASSRRLVAVG